MTGSADELDAFYAALKEGVTVETFLRLYGKILGGVRSRGFTEHYRLGKGRLKKLSDEVTPAARFVRTYAKPGDRISFALDNSRNVCSVASGTNIRFSLPDMK